MGVGAAVKKDIRMGRSFPGVFGLHTEFPEYFLHARAVPEEKTADVGPVQFSEEGLLRLGQGIEAGKYNPPEGPGYQSLIHFRYPAVSQGPRRKPPVFDIWVEFIVEEGE